ncbi:MAG: MBL fold metallo-hydrolase [bacterium]|nr:MBL fold metallo-hydrolase [bacterium]
MILQPFMIDVGSQEVNVYLVGDEATRVGFIVDAGGFPPALPDAAGFYRLAVTHVLLTHLHWDHTGALSALLAEWPNLCVVAAAPCPAAPNVHLVEDGAQLRIGPIKVDVLQTSGHTPESVSYYLAEPGVCFVGDALFAGAVGGTGDDARHREQITLLREKILALPEATEILPGHGPLTTGAIEKRANPFFRPGFGRLA